MFPSFNRFIIAIFLTASALSLTICRISDSCFIASHPQNAALCSPPQLQHYITLPKRQTFKAPRWFGQIFSKPISYKSKVQFFWHVLCFKFYPNGLRFLFLHPLSHSFDTLDSHLIFHFQWAPSYQLGEDSVNHSLTPCSLFPFSQYFGYLEFSNILPSFLLFQSALQSYNLLTFLIIRNSILFHLPYLISGKAYTSQSPGNKFTSWQGLKAVADKVSGNRWAGRSAGDRFSNPPVCQEPGSTGSRIRHGVDIHGIGHTRKTQDEGRWRHRANMD